MANVYQDWKFFADITVTNPSSTEGFQAKLTLAWLPGMRGDFRDIRFADKNGNDLSYWIESKTDFSSATVWVRLPANDKNIKLYYGNGVAESESEADSVFEFFDDFEGSSLNTEKWTIVQNNGISVSGGILTISSGSSNYGEIRTNNAIGPDVIVEARIATRTYFSSIGLGAADDTGDGSSIGLVYYSNYESAIYTGSSFSGRWTPPRSVSSGSTDGDIISSPPTGYFIEEFAVPNGEKLRQRRNGGAWTISTRYNGISSAQPLHVIHYRGYASCYIDYIRVRKYSDTETTLSISRKQSNFKSFGFLFSTGPETSFTLPCTGISLGPATPRMVGDFPVSSIAGISIGPVSKIIQEALILPCSGLTLQGGYSPLRDTITLPCSGIDLSLDPYGFREYADLNAIGVKKIEIARSINDSMWTMNIETVGELSVSEFMHVFYDAEDTAGNSYHVFSGIVPTTAHKYVCADYSNQQTAYDYGYYLSRQYLPLDCLVMNLGGDYSSWDQWITRLLDETGILPHKINTCGTSNKEFVFTAATTKLEAIQKICEYTGFIFFVKWVNGGTEDEPFWEPAAWFVNQADIDDPINGLDLPDPVTISWPAGDLVDLPRVETPSDEKINRVRVRGTDGNGNWYSAIKETAAVMNGRHRPVEYVEDPSPFATTESGALARANALYNYFTANVATVEATFIKRPDLQLWQKIQFSGSEFPAVVTAMGWLRIISIKYSFAVADETVTITAVKDRDNSILLSNTDLLLQDNVSETELIVDSKLDQLLKAEIGTVIAINGNIATVETESGKTIKVRIV